MNLPLATAVVLAVAASVACLRVAWRWHRLRRQVRPWRPIVLLLAQPLFAGLLYLTLFPPERAVRAEAVLTVLAEGADAREAMRARGRVVALPEAPAVQGAERVPDLATALRRYPDTRALHLIGFGLPARDRDAAAGFAMEAAFPPMPRGLHALAVEEDVVAGARFAVSGRVAGADGAQVELRDPAGRLVDAVAVHEGGEFLLHAPAFAPGSAMFDLQVSDGDGVRIETADVPVRVQAAPRLRVLLLAGAPNPETRALRRWLQDAGFDVDARIALGAGMQLGDAPSITTDALARHDLLIADARAWSDLGRSGRATVLQAVDAGLGLMVRADTVLAGAALQSLQGDGLRFEGGRGTKVVRVPAPILSGDDAIHAWRGTGSDDAPIETTGQDEDIPTLTHRDWRVVGTGAVPMRFAAEGAPPGWWHARGEGRVGIWTLLDTWRLPLSGHADLHAGLWNAGLSPLVRARARDAAEIIGTRRVDERLAICTPAQDAFVLAPDGRRVALVADAAARGCAAFWPRSAGWHVLETPSERQWFHVSNKDALPGVRVAELREATLALAARPDRPALSDERVGVVHQATSAWPWFLAWLALAAALWWLERSRLGHREVGGESR
ncbi:carboxypeptidase regulatory-like domain-containing protein [Luteimonas aestuarii]|uniref:Carboxypeptidase regulatory-like domain-containing protein n=1 Tax=Luteimonas aestuarii TaxID=453837 RepID=A0A4R5TVA7_9GAMM|nr:carboxypeptidase regulatory-like domain-containing protein [Luteimonas aestuarii]TDK25027.1 carboxypeptidase regulatory-like domain-containing protein [Luteimonas aestuarii]